MAAEKRFQCYTCGQTLPVNSFYKSGSKLYSGVGYLPVCKSCLDARVASYKSQYNDNAKAVQRICMAFDIYYNAEYMSYLNDFQGDILGEYMRRVQGARGRALRTFDNTISEGFVFYDSGCKGINQEESKQGEKEKRSVDERLVMKWGEGFDAEDYEVLEKHHKYLKSANPNCDSNQDIFITDLCFIKMQQIKAVRENRIDDFNKLTESYRKSFAQANLKIARENDVTDKFLLGVGIEDIERYTPAEYYKDKKLYDDYDSLGDYFERFVLRPLKNLQLGSDERDKQYFVKDDGDDDGYDDN